MIQFKYYNEDATFDASSLNNDDIAFVEDENALYTHGKKFKFVDEVNPATTHVIARITDGRDSDTAPSGVVANAWLHLLDTITGPCVFTNNNSKLEFYDESGYVTARWSSLDDDEAYLWQSFEEGYPVTPNNYYLESEGQFDATLLNNVFETV